MATEPLTGDADGTEFLTPSEERILARWVAAARLAGGAAQTAGATDELARCVRNAGTRARDRMILANMGLVGSLVARFVDRATKLDRDDLFQEGVLGLMRAIEKFDPDKGYRLTTYATWWIQQHLRRAIDFKARTIRLPHHIEDDLRRLKKRRTRLRAHLDRPPTAAELSRELGLEEGEVNLLLRVEQDAVGLDEADYEGHSGPPRGNGRRGPGPAAEFEQRELTSLIERQLHCLDMRSRFIIIQRFELQGRSKYTLQTLGDKLEITRERVRQIEATSLARLSEGRGGEALMDYVED